MDMTHQGYHQTVANIEAAIVKYASLGLEVQITEMDVSLYIPGITYTSDMFYTTATFTDALQTKQAERYRAFFDMFRAHKDRHHRRHPLGHRRRQHLALRVHLRPQGLPAAVRRATTIPRRRSRPSSTSDRYLGIRASSVSRSCWSSRRRAASCSATTAETAVRTSGFSSWSRVGEPKHGCASVA